MFKKVMRLTFAVLFGAIGFWGWEILKRYLEYKEISISVPSFLLPLITVTVFAVIGFFAGSPLADLISRENSKLVRWAKGKSAKDVRNSFLGFAAGLVIAFLISQIFANISNEALVTALNVIIYLFFAILGVRIATIKRAENEDGTIEKVTVIDSSAVIDGRIAGIVETGFLQGKITVPKFVVDRISSLADSDDEQKRTRAKRGLETLKLLKKNKAVFIDGKKYDKSIDGDELLIAFAKEANADIVTVDGNVLALAGLQNVRVLNVNELALVMKISLASGDKLEVTVSKEGKDRSQGVGFLDDGTMIVIEDGKDYLGEKVACEVTSLLQTSSGKMVFAKICK